MNIDGMYSEVTQEYLRLYWEKKKLMEERDKIKAQLEVIDGILIDLDDILCKHGKHVYDHFEEEENDNRSAT